MNSVFVNPTHESVTNFLKSWIKIIPRYIKHDHGLCIAKLNDLLTKATLQLISVKEMSIHVQWKPHTIVYMDLYIMNDSITIKDYTYVIPPFYECKIPFNPLLHAPA